METYSSALMPISGALGSSGHDMSADYGDRVGQVPHWRYE